MAAAFDDLAMVDDQHLVGIADGTSFLLGSSMSREEVQKLAEDLVPAK
jgi:hypothetical protein